MKLLQSVFLSDGPNLSDETIATRALPRILWEGFQTGLPSNLSHDSRRLVGWASPNAVFVDPGSAQLLGLYELPETEEEEKEIENRAHISQDILYAQRDTDIKALRSLLDQFTHESSTESEPPKHCLAECVALYQKGLARRVFAELFEVADEDKAGLIPLEKLETIGPGVYKVGELAVFAHAFFRRSLTRLNSLNTPFLERLENIKRDGITVKIALDPDLVGLASTYAKPLEFEHWWGPKFSDQLMTIPTGVTRYRASDLDRAFYSLLHTEFRWSSRKGLHTLEAEEVRDAPTRTEDSSLSGYHCRYVHSIVRESDGQVIHFDGAVRGYTEEEMIARLDSDIKGSGRNTQYTKLWRLDAPIGIREWKSLLSDYYRDNRLVGEYLGAQPENQTHLTDSTVNGANADEAFDISHYVPHFFRRGEGVRILLAFDARQECVTAERVAVPLHTFEMENQTVDVIESTVIELKKALQRQGLSMDIPSPNYVLHYKDLHKDFGLIAHNGDKSVCASSVQATLQSIRRLVRAWKDNESFGSVAYTITFPIEDCTACVSVIGHIADLCDWLDTTLCCPPMDKEDLFLWVEKSADFLRENYPSKDDKPTQLTSMLPFGGSLMKRKQIETINFEKVDGEIHWVMEQDATDRIPGLTDALNQGQITPASCFVVDKATCNKCQQDYYTCPCCKTLDDEVKNVILQYITCIAVWSNDSELNVRTRMSRQDKN